MSADDEREHTQIVQVADAPTGAAEDVPYLIILRGPGAGEMFRLDRTMTIGRDDEADIRLSDSAVSRHHARVVVRSVGVFVTDLKSSNGTLLNGERLTAPAPLRDGDKIAIGTTTILKFSYHDRLEEEFQQGLFHRARRDPLTGVWKRKYFDERLQIEFAYARRHKQPLSLLLLDVDHFKRVNDAYGHPIGDAVLIAFCRRVATALREEDFFARYGGEEFVVLCRNTSEVQAAVLAERLRAGIADPPFTLTSVHGPLRVTVSIGIAAFPAPSILKPAELVAAADAAVYSAKRAGRNRVAFPEPSRPSR